MRRALQQPQLSAVAQGGGTDVEPGGPPELWVRCSGSGDTGMPVVFRQRAGRRQQHRENSGDILRDHLVCPAERRSHAQVRKLPEAEERTSQKVPVKQLQFPLTRPITTGQWAGHSGMSSFSDGK